MIDKKNILLGITGGIAAYKCAELVRALTKKGAKVRVVMTPAACDFVTPLTLSVLSGNEVHSTFVSDEENPQWNNHVELALWADYMVIAPLTSKTLADMVSGHSENLLTATYMSAKCPVFFAPAMDRDMYKHPATRKNIEKLRSYGHVFIPPGEGPLASGLEGEGRMAEPAEIVEVMEEHIRSQQPLYGKKVLVNAGPTYEDIDPVRFIGNRSSGKMGIALAETARHLGAEVTLVLGPSYVSFSEEGMRVIRVRSAGEMHEACGKHFAGADYTILSAAVSDFRPETRAEQKIKKERKKTPAIDLVQTEDILKSLGEKKKKGQFLMGFALETEKGEESARKKLREKNLDCIALNSPDNEERGFEHDTNEILLIDKNNKKTSMGLKRKDELAREIWNYVVENYV